VTAVADPFQLRVARVALSVIEPHGFALGGGQALRAYGLVRRPTEDIDLVTDGGCAMRTAADLVTTALIADGLRAEAPIELGADLDFLTSGDDFAELDAWDDDVAVRISLARLPRRRRPVRMAVGLVLHVDDVLGVKMCALVSHVEARDFVDIAAAVAAGHSRRRLLRRAREHQPDLRDSDLAAAISRLDVMPDSTFTRLGLSGSDVAALRRHFADWPR
jgi:hypothetical protein